jgi:hypothetical protein
MAPRLGLGGGVTADPASGLFGAPNLLLDNFPGAHRAYSVRKLSKNYEGYAMKVREGSGMNYTNDIAFDDDGRVSLDSKVYNRSDSGTNGVTLSSYLSGYSNPDLMVTTWYDQSSSGVNAVQTAPTQQPKLYKNSGGLVTDGSPARAALEFDGSNDHIHIDESGLSLGSTYTFAVFNTTVDYGSTSGTKVPWSLSTALGNWYSHVIISSTDAFYYDPGYPYPAYFYPAVPNQHLWAYKGITGSQIMYKDGTASSGTGTNSETDALTDTADNGIGGYPSGGAAFYWPGEFQEFIVYDSDQSSNRTDIEADINTEFGM